MRKQGNRWYPRHIGTNRALLAIVLVSIAGLTSPLTAHSDTNKASATQLPAGKQTMLGLYVTSREAYEKWNADPDKVMIIDVRTPEEFLFIGHADMAWNIPLANQSYTWDAEKKTLPMSLLPDFVARVQKVVGPDDTLLVTCRSGGRSAKAVNLLAKAGFKNVYNITDGVEGDAVKDTNSVFDGQRLVNGWKNSGLPWTYRIDPDRLVFPAEQ
jgi:rhodanese-related sulfurtransferase